MLAMTLIQNIYNFPHSLLVILFQICNLEIRITYKYWNKRDSNDVFCKLQKFHVLLSALNQDLCFVRWNTPGAQLIGAIFSINKVRNFACKNVKED